MAGGRDRAVDDGGARIPEQRELVGAGRRDAVAPADEEDVGYAEVRPEESDFGQELDGSLAVPLLDQRQLRQALGSVQLDRAAERIGLAPRLPQEIQGHRLDPARQERAANPTAVRAIE